MKSGQGPARLIRATRCSVNGLAAALRNEAAFREETALAAILVPAGLWLGESGIERALLAGAIVLVLIIELLNSGIEAVVDRFGGEIHELSGRAKDLGSAAVFLALVNVVLVWGLVLLS
jgi:diacylglycerol kinase (ATP)